MMRSRARCGLRAQVLQLRRDRLANKEPVGQHFFKVDPDGSKFGHLPKMALASKGMMGVLMAASFCERINSCANLVVTEGNSLLSTDEIDKCVVLRMNKTFMEFMRKNYPEVLNSKHARFGSVVRVDDCLVERQEDDQPGSIDMG